VQKSSKGKNKSRDLPLLGPYWSEYNSPVWPEKPVALPPGYSQTGGSRA